MIAEVELVTLHTEPCAACGERHRHRAALRGPDTIGFDSLLGFFAACPATGRRQWYVLPVPGGLDRRRRVLGLGPADDDRWEPAAADVPARAYDALPRGKPSGGFRDPADFPALLRRALGCPMS